MEPTHLAQGFWTPLGSQDTNKTPISSMRSSHYSLALLIKKSQLQSSNYIVAHTFPLSFSEALMLLSYKIYKKVPPVLEKHSIAHLQLALLEIASSIHQPNSGQPASSNN